MYSYKHVVFVAVLGFVIGQAVESKLKSITGTIAEGRNLEAYEAAANYIRGATKIPERWRKMENYRVVFIGEHKGFYVLQFLPIWKKDEPLSLDYDFDSGVPVRFTVRKTDMKVVRAVLEGLTKEGLSPSFKPYREPAPPAPNAGLSR